jgi:hypothetical protein
MAALLSKHPRGCGVYGMDDMLYLLLPAGRTELRRLEAEWSGRSASAPYVGNVTVQKHLIEIGPITDSGGF